MSTEQPTTAAVTVQSESAKSEIGQILHHAVEKGVPVETLERLVALKERMDDRAAAQEFNVALAAFQSECPPIKKTSAAKITTRSGGEYGYKYAELDEIARTTRPLLNKHGLSYTWDCDVTGNRLTCTCTLRHVAGHSQSAKFAVSTETSSAMSDQQKVAAALTYARRQSLIQALGLTTTDDDDDGASHAGSEPITDEQVFELNEALAAIGGDRARFLKFMGVDAMEAISARDLTKARNALAQAKAAHEKKAREAAKQ